MLAIRMQRTGRKGQAMFRVVVQDSRQTPSSGRVVAQIGSYNPHTKEVQIDKDKATFYLKNGAQPSERTARLFKSEGIKLPDWVVLDADHKRTIRNPEKLRKNRPAEEASPEAANEEAPADTEATETTTEVPAAEEPTAETAEAPATKDNA